MYDEFASTVMFTVCKDSEIWACGPLWLVVEFLFFFPPTSYSIKKCFKNLGLLPHDNSDYIMINSLYWTLRNASITKKTKNTLDPDNERLQQNLKIRWQDQGLQKHAQSLLHCKNRDMGNSHLSSPGHCSSPQALRVASVHLPHSQHSSTYLSWFAKGEADNSKLH